MSLTKVVAHHMRNKNALKGGSKILHLAQVIQASCSQTLGSDLSSRASVKTGCLSKYWVAVKYSIQMELGERALEF